MTGRNRSPAQEAAECARALTLHSQGLTEARISTLMTEEGRVTNIDYKISQATVHRRIKAGLGMYTVPALDEAKATELRRIDGVLAAQAEAVSRGDAKAAMVVLKAVQIRSAILGLDAPKTTETKVEVAHPATGILERVKQARQITASNSDLIQDAQVVEEADHA